MIHLLCITIDHVSFLDYNLCLFNNNTILDTNDTYNSFHSLVEYSLPEICDLHFNPAQIQVLPDTFESFNNLIFSYFIFSYFICNTLNIPRKISSI